MEAGAQHHVWAHCLPGNNPLTLPLEQCVGYGLGYSEKVGTVKRRLTTWIRSEKSVVRRFRRCANIIDCT